MGRVNDWSSKYEFSRGENEKQDLVKLKSIIDGCISIVKTDSDTDRQGIDYIATLRSGAKINIDAKRREKGCSKYWANGEPELALEIWSVTPDRNHQGKTGWTLSESSNVDMILYGFDPLDCDTFYLLPFQHLRMAFRNNYYAWASMYGVKTQTNSSWTSQAVFVPVSVVISAITSRMKYKQHVG